MAGTTGLEPATSDVTGRRSNQLNYVPVLRRTFRMVTQGLNNSLISVQNCGPPPVRH